jgi:MFS family permease
MLAGMSEQFETGGDPVAAEALTENLVAEAAEPTAGAVARRPSLWHHADFMKVWTAATVSLMGSAVSQLAIPYIAAVVLGSSNFEVALLSAIEFAPFLLFALPAGAWLDRVRRRPVLIGGDLGRGIALLTIPAAYLAGVLTIWQLYVVGFITGTLTVFFDVADQSYLPALLDKEDLVEGNSKLTTPQASAQILGPALAGNLITRMAAPLTITLDAISFFVSGALISLIRRPEPKPERPAGKDGVPNSFRQDVSEGLHYVLGNRYLRMIAGATATSNLGANIVMALQPVFLFRELQLSPSLVGTSLGLSAFGLLVGAFIAQPLARRIHTGPTIVLSIFIDGPALFLFALTPPDPAGAALCIFTSAFVIGLSVVVYNVHQVSYRQAITPLEMQGRMNATMRFIVWGTIPIGAILGGILATFLPLRTTMFIGATVASLAFLWVLLSPVRTLVEIPNTAGAEQG